MEKDEKAINGKETKAEKRGTFTTEEKAQYEVFANGNLPRETLDKWIRNDINSAMSLLHASLTDETIFKALGDAFEARYRKLHEQKVDDDHSPKKTLGHASK